MRDFKYQRDRDENTSLTCVINLFFLVKRELKMV